MKNSIEQFGFYLAKKGLLDSYPWKGRLDPPNIVMIGISESLPGHAALHELHYLLNTLLSIILSAAERLKILKTASRISRDNKIKPMLLYNHSPILADFMHR